MSDDDDWWTTWISLTPEQDRQFQPVGRVLVWIVGVLVVIGTILVLLH